KLLGYKSHNLAPGLEGLRTNFNQNLNPPSSSPCTTPPPSTMSPTETNSQSKTQKHRVLVLTFRIDSSRRLVFQPNFTQLVVNNGY
ncbi:hypothetical protein J6590_008147, partial [Homalodisca vitripennis]